LRFAATGRGEALEKRVLLLRRTVEAAAKPLGFAPHLANLSAKAGEPGGYLHDDECDHFYCPAPASKRPI
jgi:hypothetical protein